MSSMLEEINHKRHHDYVCAILQGVVSKGNTNPNCEYIVKQADKMQKAFIEFHEKS